MEIPFSILSATSDHTPSPVAEIKEQIDSLLELTGERASNAVIDQVFDRFCVGK